MGHTDYLIVDMDGTLLECTRHYNAAMYDVADLLHDEYGLDKGSLVALMHGLDVWSIQHTELGSTRERFPLTLAAAAAVTGTFASTFINPSLVSDCWKRGDALFSEAFTPYLGALERLKEFKDAGWYVLLYTKGDLAVQQSKITRWGIADLVTAIEITGVKSTEVLATVCEKHGIPRNAVYVGDSVRDDINPAAALGLFPIRVAIHGADQRPFAEELPDEHSKFVVDRFAELTPTGLLARSA